MKMQLITTVLYYSRWNANSTYNHDENATNNHSTYNYDENATNNHITYNYDENATNNHITILLSMKFN